MMHEHKICPACGGIMSYNRYFKRWECLRCGHIEKKGSVFDDLRFPGM